MRLRGLLCPLIAVMLGAALGLGAPAYGQGAEPVARGRVLDAVSGTPIVGAIVRLAGDTTARTITDTHGDFRLTLPTRASIQLMVARVGYASRTIDLQAPPATVVTILLTTLSQPLDAVVVTADRRQQTLANVVVPTELISHDAIERTGASDVASVLTQQLGIQLNGGTPSGTGVALQGFGGEEVLILLDGEPLVGSINGTFDLSRIPVSMIDHIEVVKGPQSTLYGSNAIGGVINIVTRRPATGGVDLTTTLVGGTQGRMDATADVLGDQGPISWTGDAGRRQLDLAPGVPGTAGTEDDSWNGSASIRWRPDSGTALFASGFLVQEFQRYQAGELYQFENNMQMSARAGADFTLGGHNHLTTQLYLTQFDNLSRASTADVPASDSGAQNNDGLAKAELLFDGSAGVVPVVAGLELQRETISQQAIEGGTRNLTSVDVYGTATWQAGPIALEPGTRMTWDQQWGSAITPRLAALYRPIAPLAIRVSGGLGYREPDFTELYLDFVNAAYGYAVRGNPNLRPERSTNLSADVEWTAGHSYVRANTFYNKFTDFIETTGPDLTGTYTYDNVSFGVTRGVEGEIGTAIGRANVDVGYTYMSTLDRSTGGPLLGESPHTARVALDYGMWRGARVSATTLFTGATPLARDSTGAVSQMRNPYTSVNVQLTQQLSGSMSVALGSDDLLNAQVIGTDWPGYTGRRIYASVTWHVGPHASLSPRVPLDAFHPSPP